MAAWEGACPDVNPGRWSTGRRGVWCRRTGVPTRCSPRRPDPRGGGGRGARELPGKAGSQSPPGPRPTARGRACYQGHPVEPFPSASERHCSASPASGLFPQPPCHSPGCAPGQGGASQPGPRSGNREVGASRHPVSSTAGGSGSPVTGPRILPFEPPLTAVGSRGRGPGCVTADAPARAESLSSWWPRPAVSSLGGACPAAPPGPGSGVSAAPECACALARPGFAFPPSLPPASPSGPLSCPRSTRRVPPRHPLVHPSASLPSGRWGQGGRFWIRGPEDHPSGMVSQGDR